MSNTIYGLHIFSSEQLRKWDKYTIEQNRISSIELMEKASKAFVDEFIKLYANDRAIRIICGLGNNGGDGLAIGRLLSEIGYNVSIYIVNEHQTKGSPDFETQLLKTERNSPTFKVQNQNDLPSFDPETIVIDAIFGYGLNRPITGLAADVISKINHSGCDVVAVDIASGLMVSHPNTNYAIVHPKYTLTFQVPKLAFLLPENQTYTGEFRVLDIGLAFEFTKNESSPFYFLQKNEVARLIQTRSTFSHKGNFGHVLLFAGNKGKMGAAMLSAKSALRSGCGLLSVLVESNETSIVQTSIWEAMCVAYHGNDEKPTLDPNAKYTFGIGPGIGQSEQATRFLKYLLLASDKPIVIDADGLNIIAKDPTLLSIVPANSIFTPHPKEFERLCGTWENDYERLEKQRSFSAQYHVYVVLKGAFSSISCPDGLVYFNSTGNPGMSTGGSGDVLTGIIVSLLAQNYSSKHSAILGTYIHGLAGDLAAVEKGQISMIASDIIEFLPAAFKELQSA